MKNITLGAKAKYPSKETINLVEAKNHETTRLQMELFVLFLLALAVFVKFGVIDLIQEQNTAEKNYNAAVTQLAQLKASNKEYDSVKQEYNKYMNSFLTDSERAEVNKADVMSMLESDVMNAVGVQSITVKGKTVTVITTSTTLSVVSNIVTTLQADSRNSYVTVTTTSASSTGSGSSYSSTGNELVSATLIITFKGGSAS